MNGFHDPSELRRQIEALSTAMESIRQAQKALVHPPALDGIRRTLEDFRRMQKALVRPPALEGIRRTLEDFRRVQKALVRPPALEAVRRTLEDFRRVQKALVRPPALEGIRRTLEDFRRVQKALVRPPALEGIRRTLEAWNTSSLALHRAIQAIRVDALDVRVRYAGDRLVAHAEEARGRDQRGRRLRKARQTATNWLGRLASRRKVRPPVGSSLRGFAEFVFSKQSYEQIYDPLISDLRFEYCEALTANRRGKARWVRVRGYGSFLAAVLAHVAASGGRVWRIFQTGGSRQASGNRD